MKRFSLELILALLSLAAVVWFTYGRALTFGFTGRDTLALIEWSQNNLSRSLGVLFSEPLLPGLPYYRPLSNLSYALDYILWGVNPVPYQVEDVFAHWASSMGLVALGFQLTRRVIVGWLAGMLLALHPDFGTIVANISYRQDVLMVMGLLWTWVTTFAFLRAKGCPSWILRLFSWLAFTLAVGAKETGLIALPLVLLLIWQQRRQTTRALAAIGLEALPYLLIAGLYMVLHVAITPRNAIPPNEFVWANLLLPLRYLQQLAVPTLGNPMASVLLVALMGALAYLLAANWQSAPRAGVGLTGLAIVLPLGVYVATSISDYVERYAYIVGAPFFLLIALLLFTPRAPADKLSAYASRAAQGIVIGIVLLWVPAAPLWGLNSTWVARETTANAYLLELDRILERLPDGTIVDLENVPPKWVWLDNIRSWLNLKWSGKQIRLGTQTLAKTSRGQPVLTLKRAPPGHVRIEAAFMMEK